MKRLLAIMLALTIIITAMSLAIADEKVRTSGEFEYTLKGNGTATIVGYNGNPDEDIIVPNMLDGYVVTTIGNSAFALNKNENSSRRSATLPQGITSIEEKAFWCSGVTSINIPNSVTHIGYGAFSANYYQVVFRISNNHPTYAVIDGALYDKKKKELLYLCHADGDLSYITIPEGIVSIGDYACYNSRTLCLTFPSTLKSIGNYAFANYDERQIFVSNETLFLESIGDYAFWNTKWDVLRISATTIGNSAYENAYIYGQSLLLEGTEKIGDSAFKDSYIKNLTIPASVKEVGAYSFAYCGPTSIYFTENSQLTTIGEGAFYQSNVSLPEESQIRSIGAHAFYEAWILNIDSVLASAETIGDYAFYNLDEYSFYNLNAHSFEEFDTRTIYKNSDKILISANCKTIPTYAFCCEGVSEFYCDIYKLQDGVEVIESQAFAKVKDFYLPESLTDIAIDAFGQGSTFVVEQGSYAERWAEENAYPYSINGQEQNLDWLHN